MVNGNDILEYEENNWEALRMQWYKLQGIQNVTSEDIQDSYIFQREAYWRFVEQEYAQQEAQ
mgnify:CR=1 FL=1